MAPRARRARPKPARVVRRLAALMLESHDEGISQKEGFIGEGEYFAVARNAAWLDDYADAQEADEPARWTQAMRAAEFYAVELGRTKRTKPEVEVLGPERGESLARAMSRPRSNQAPATATRWLLIRATTPSGKRLFVCTDCGRLSPTPDKKCPGDECGKEERP